MENMPSSSSASLASSEAHFLIEPPRGWAALAGCYMGSAFVGQERPLPLLQKVKEYSEQALKLDPLLPEGLQTAAWAKMMLDWDWEETERLSHACGRSRRPTKGLLKP